MPHTWRRTNVDLPMAGSPMTNMLGCSMMPARNQLIGSQHTPAPVVMLRPMGTPSTGSAMSVLNGQNPPHTWVLVPKNSSIVGMSPPHPPPLERRPFQDGPAGVGGMDWRRTGMSGSMVRPVFFPFRMVPFLSRDFTRARRTRWEACSS